VRGELPAVWLLDHEVELDFAIVVAGHAGGAHSGDDSAGPYAVTDEIELRSGHQAFMNQQVAAGPGERHD